MITQSLLKQCLSDDYVKLQFAFEKKEWKKTQDVNHALLGALMYCDLPYLKKLSIMVQNAAPTEIESAVNQLLHEMKRIINNVV